MFFVSDVEVIGVKNLRNLIFKINWKCIMLYILSRYNENKCYIE